MVEPIFYMFYPKLTSIVLLQFIIFVLKHDYILVTIMMKQIITKYS